MAALSGPIGVCTGNCRKRCIVRFYCIALLLGGPACGARYDEAFVVLPVDEAFELSARRDGARIAIRFDVTDGHYLYRDRLSVLSGGKPVGLAALPEGVAKDDPYFGRVQVLPQGFGSTFADAGHGEFTVRYQGCAEAGFCYPPQEREFRIAAEDSSLHISRDPRSRTRSRPF